MALLKVMEMGDTGPWHLLQIGSFLDTATAS